MKLLIVDDQAPNLRLLRAQLEAEGHEVFDAANGLAALKVLDRETVDGVISDILMPQMDGYRLCLEIRRSAPHYRLPLVLYTSTYDSQSDRMLAESAGADAYIVKPAPTQVLLQALQDAAKRSRSKTEVSGNPEIEAPVLSQYNEALVRKLEEKSQELMRTHESLVQVETRLSGLIESAMDAIVAIDSNHKIILFNAAASHIFKCTREEAIGRPFNDFIPLRYREAHTLLIDSFGSEDISPRQRTGTQQIWALSMDGTEFPVEASISKLDTSQGNLYTVFIRDITERYRAQQELAESRERFQQISESIRDVFFLRTINSESMLYISPAYEDIWGRSRQSLYDDPKSWMDSIHPDDREVTQERLTSGLSAGRFEMEFRIVRPDGAVRWIESRGFPVTDESGRILRVAGVAKDITEKVRVAQELDHHVRRLEILRDMNIAILEARSPEDIAAAGLRSLRQVIPFWGATAMKFDLDSGTASVLAIERATSASYDPGAALTLDQYGQADLSVLKRGEICIVADLAAAPNRPPILDTLFSQGMLSYVRIPLIAEGVLIGVLNIASKYKEFFTQKHIEFARPVADQLAISLQQALLRRSVQQLNRIHRMLSGTNTLIMRVSEREELFREACRLAIEAGGFHKAWIGLGSDAASFRVVAGHGYSRELFPALQERIRSNIANDIGQIAQALHDLQPAVSNYMGSDTKDLVREFAEETGSRSIAILPLVVRRKPIGVLTLHSNINGFFNTGEMKLLCELADNISFALWHLEQAEQIDYLATHDAVTGLPNRRLFMESLAQSVVGRSEADGVLAVVLVDLNRFRRVNETLGIAAGDELLRMVAGRMKQINPTVARIGPNQFALRIERIQLADIARVVTERVGRCFRESFTIGAEEYRISSRVGVAVYPEDGTDAEMLLRNAEVALRGSREHYEPLMFYAEEMNTRVANVLRIETQLRRALERGEFLLHYQPKVSMADRRIVGAEALIRWLDPRRGLVPPVEFIGIMEETGLIGDVGCWVIGQALRDIQAWAQKGLNLPRVAVNVSTVQMQRKNFVDLVIDEVQRAGDVPHLLELEVTETLLMRDIEASIRKLSILRGIGIHISMDDFGTGYSSLSYLARLPIDKVKIDRAFITNVTDNLEDATIVSSIIALVHSLDRQVIAEGVETEEQATFLKLLGCDEIQGYLISKPIPADAFELLMLANQNAIGQKI